MKLRSPRFAALSVATLALGAWLLLTATGRAAEPVRCGTIWYAWYATTPAVVDYTEEPGLSITIVGTYLWAQNTAEPASSTQHLTSVKLTPESPNPYTICVGDTTTTKTGGTDEPEAVRHTGVPQSTQATETSTVRDLQRPSPIHGGSPNTAV